MLNMLLYITKDDFAGCEVGFDNNFVTDRHNLVSTTVADCQELQNDSVSDNEVQMVETEKVYLGFFC